MLNILYIVTTAITQMGFQGQKVNLSFSIENILRDDFARSQRKTSFADLPIADAESGFGPWPANSALYQCCPVRYSPVYAHCPPDMYRVERRFHRSLEEKEQIFREQAIKLDEDNASQCKDEVVEKQKDGVNGRDCKKEAKPIKCFRENGPKRKRRNRSHFTQRQLQYLDKIFSRQQYLTRDERTLLARGLEMTELQIRNWFQNRRYQRRHRSNEEKKQDEPVTSAAI